MTYSYIHGNFQAIQAILEDIKKEPIDSIVCLGDVIGIGPNSKETLQLIAENKIEMILENRVAFENSIRKVNYPEKQEIYKINFLCNFLYNRKVSSK